MGGTHKNRRVSDKPTLSQILQEMCDLITLKRVYIYTYILNLKINTSRVALDLQGLCPRKKKKNYSSEEHIQD